MRLLILFVVLCLAGCAGPRVIETRPYKAPAGVVHEAGFLVPEGRGAPSLYLQSWLPAGQAPAALVLYVPANIEHGGLIGPVAEALAQAGYGVYAVDLRGLGRSARNGDFWFVRDHDEYVQDIAVAVAEMRARHPGMAVHGAGESLGAALLLRGDIAGLLRFDSLVLADTAFQPNPGLGVLPLPDFMARFLVWSGGQAGRIIPSAPSVPARFSINAVSCSAITRGELLHDPYVVKGWLPAKFITTLADTQSVLGSGLEQVRTPILAIHGGKDGVVPVKSSREIVRRVASTEKLLLVIPDGCHTTMIEEGTRGHVVRMLKEWLVRRGAVPGVSLPTGSVHNGASPTP